EHRDRYRDRNVEPAHRPTLKIEAPWPWGRHAGQKSEEMFCDEQPQNTASHIRSSSPLPSLFTMAKIASAASPNTTASTTPVTLP
ncbi:MAG: hypothetical protein WBE14_00005, partial [Xanthobacteraceae bacterium]